MNDKYTVINKKEPRGQSIAKNGIPCTARNSVTTLNRLMRENYRLSVKVQGINELLNDLYEGIDEHYTETLENNDELAIACADAELQLIKKIIDEVERI